MLISSVKNSSSWHLVGPLGEDLVLPKATKGPFRIGLLGTRAEQVKKDKTGEFARLIEAVKAPVILIDIRRDGVGANSAWGPLEFGTIVPSEVTSPYSFHHLPVAAPTVDLLKSFKKSMRTARARAKDGLAPLVLEPNEIKKYSEQLAKGVPTDVPDYGWQHWQIFRARYSRELDPTAVQAARAFVEAASVVGGVAIFLCAEEYRPSFDQDSQADQDEYYCHRYTLAKEIAKSLHSDFSGDQILQRSYRMGVGAEEAQWDNVSQAFTTTTNH
jgi:hypothetical protein